MTPRVSVIIPAFRAFDTLARGLETVAACGLPERAVEIVIAPDDGADYSRFSDGWGQRRVLPPGPVRSGAGPTRNRALAAASGDFIAFLDADDSWEEGYLAATLPLARAHGVAFGRTSIVEDGREILRLPRTATLHFTDVGATGASFHPVLRRDWAGPFVNRPSQDVLHTVEALALAGGRAPVAEPAYRIHLNPVSTTAAADYSARRRRRLRRPCRRHKLGRHPRAAAPPRRRRCRLHRQGRAQRRLQRPRPGHVLRLRCSPPCQGRRITTSSV